MVQIRVISHVTNVSLGNVAISTHEAPDTVFPEQILTGSKNLLMK